MDWSKLCWRILCGLALAVVVLAFTPIFWVLPSIVQAIAALPGLLVTLLLVAASFVPSTRSSMPPEQSTGR